MAKNSEVYTTAQERAEAFREFCEKAQVDCAKCPANDGCEYKYSAEGALNWLDLEAEEEKPETIEDVIYDMRKTVEMMSKKEGEGATLLDVSVIFDKFLNRIIAAHNRVAKAVNESEAKK